MLQSKGTAELQRGPAAPDRLPGRPPKRRLRRPIRSHDPRPLLAGLAVALIAFGIGMLVFPVTTDVYTARAQRRLRSELAGRLLQPSAAAVVPPGGSLGLIQIPKLAVNDVIVEGTDPQALREAPGHYAGTPQPCTAGNAAVAGHRTTYGKPFSRLDELVPGDRITVVTTRYRCTYEVVGAPAGRLLPHAGSAAWITGPNDWSAVGPLPGFDLTLTTCQPPGSATQRLIVRARLLTMG